MPDALLKALERSPELLAIVVIIYLGLKFLEKMDEKAGQRTMEFIDSVKMLHQENMEAREQSRAVIERNTTEAVNNSNAVREMTVALKEFIRER